MENQNSQTKCARENDRLTDVNIQKKYDVDQRDNKQNDQNLDCNFMRPYKCQQCNLTFDRASQHGYHYRSFHLGEKSQICQICGKGFFRKADLRTHLNIHLGTNLYICEICGRKFNHVSNLIRHCKMHRVIKSYPCSICGERFTQISSLVRHKRIHQRTNEQSVDDSALDNRKIKSRRQYYCTTCGESFIFLFLLKEHEKRHSLGLERAEHKNEVEASNTQEDKSHEVSKKTNNCVIECNLIMDDVLRDTAQSFETIVHVTSEQINLKQTEDAAEYFIQNQLDKNTNKIVDATSDKSGDSYDHRSILDNSHIVSWKYDERKQVNGINNDDNINAKSVDYLYRKDEHDLLSADKNSFAYLTNDAYIDETLIYKETEQENSSENEKLYIGTPEEEFYKCSNSCSIAPFEKQNLNETDVIGDNNERLKDRSVGMSQQENFVHEAENTNENIDSTTLQNHEGPTLRLVQTETGEQFYELIINASSEKGNNNVQCSKSFEDKFEENSIIENSNKMNSQMKENPVKIQNQENEQELHCFADANNDLQVEFEKYVRTNLEAFEKSNYENSADHFLELMEIANENIASKNSLTVCVIPNREEQLCELLQDTRIANESTNEDYVQNKYIEENILTENNAVEVDKDEPNSFNLITYDDKHLLNTENTTLENNSRSLQTDFPNDKHIKDMSQEAKKTKTFSKKFQCNVCEKAFSSSYNYKQHIGTHFTDQQSFRCKECGRSFAWKSTLNKHIANNHRQDGPQKFVCEICPKVYNTLSQVNEHVKRDHLKQRNHVCPHCGKSFFKKSDMETHSRTHTDERPYVCRICGKRFHHQSHIIRHERTHSGERPYACDICQKTFAQAGSLKAHKQKHQRNERNILDYQIDEDDPVAFISM